MASTYKWNRASGGAVRNRRAGSRLYLRWIAVAILLAVTAVGVWLFFSRPDSALPKAPPKMANAPIVQPVAVKVTEPISDAPEPALTNAAQKRLENDVEVVSSTVKTNSTGAIIERIVLADGKKVMKVHPPKPIFGNACDQVIAMAISVKPGQSMPPFPHLDKSLEQDFLDSLSSPIVINDDDSDEVKELKARVKETKAYIVDEIKNGGSLLELLREHQKEMENVADSHLMAIQEMQNIKKEYGDEAAREFIKEVNESFKVRGIAEIEFRDNKKDKERH